MWVPGGEKYTEVRIQKTEGRRWKTEYRIKREIASFLAMTEMGLPHRRKAGFAIKKFNLTWI